MLQASTRRWALEHGRYPAAVAEVWPLCVGKTALLEVGCSLDTPPFEGTERALLALRVTDERAATDMFVLASGTEGGPPWEVAPGGIRWVVRGDPDAPSARALRDAVRAWLARPLAIRGRPATLSVEEKRLVLKHVVQQNEADGTPRERLTLRDAADSLELLCQESQPILIDGRLIVLPAPFGSPGFEPADTRQSTVERLRQWLYDIFGHKSWERAKKEL